jgi:hypothetical protein
MTPEIVGITSENAAHRIAVTWRKTGQPREGVFISRRDTNSQLNHVLGGRVFPVSSTSAHFSVVDSDGKINLKVKSDDAMLWSNSPGETSQVFPNLSFSSVPEASAFFEARLSFSDARA